MGRERLQTVQFIADRHLYHLLYYQHPVQLTEAAVGHYLCDSCFLYRCVSNFLLVQA